MNMRVLQICPFDVPDAPTSGGQIRMAAIAQAYRDLGCQVDQSCILTRKRDLRRPADLMMPWLDRVRRPHIGAPHNIGPLRQRWSSLRSTALCQTLQRVLPAAPDLIHVEHPWAIRVACQLRAQATGRRPHIVYSAHNIEHSLYRDLWTAADAWNDAAQKMCTQILEAERECVREADVVWAVSAQDAATLRQLGARKVLVVPNGCRTFSRRHNSPCLPPLPYVIFVGGLYAPNLEGFLTWIGPELDALPSGTSIVVAGGVCDALSRHPALHTARQDGRMRLLGRVSSEWLDQLILHSQGIVLPISQGGGTNLKTAEALCAKRPIVATTASLRGFEAWQDAEQVHVAQTPEEFRRHIRQLLSHPFMPDASRDTNSLCWDAILKQALQQTLVGLEPTSVVDAEVGGTS